MNLAVKFYRNDPNKPVGLPDDWPKEVREIGLALDYTSEPGPWVIMSKEDYEGFLLANRGEYGNYIKNNFPAGTPNYPVIPGIDSSNPIYTKIESAYSRLSWNIVVDGNSLLVPANGNTLVTDALVGANGGISPHDFTNLSASGLTTTQLLARAPDLIDTVLNADVPLGKRIYIVWELTNDIALGATAAQAYSALKNLCVGRKTAGFGKVIALPCLPRSNSNLVGGFESTRLDTNSRVLAGLSEGWLDSFPRLDQDPNIGLTGCSDNPVYFAADRVHLLAPGQAIGAQFLRSGFNQATSSVVTEVSA